jgi:Cu2+-exporting ATPase
MLPGTTVPTPGATARAPGANGRAEAVLAVEGIHCASCVQLIEMQVGSVPGVESVDVGLATHRARVRWQDGVATLADITAAIARAGYRAWPVSAGGAARERSRERRMALWRLFVAGFSMMQVMMYATPAYVAIEGEMEPDIAQLLRLASFILTVPVMCYSAGPLLAGAWRDLRHRRIGMDVPAALGLLVTFGASTWAVFVSGGPVYFDSVSMFVFFLLGARYLDMLARARAGAAVEELSRLQPVRAQLLPGWPLSRQTLEVEAAQLRPGDVVLVRAGTAAPADGRVLEGDGSNDESLITGEARAVKKGAGDAITGGAINLSRPLVVQVGAAVADSRLSHLVRLVESAANAKPWITQVADRHAATFLWAILGLAAITALVWSAIDPAHALPAAVAVLIVTCPCALSLAAPMAFAAAIGNLAQRGVLVVRGHALEALARADHFVFDKTGTLTTGRMRVEEVRPLGRLDRDHLLALAARMESVGVHPLAQALAMAGAQQARRLCEGGVTDAHEVPGQGVEALVNGMPHRVGSIGFVQSLHHRPPPAGAFAATGNASVVALGDSEGWLGIFTVGDGVRGGAAALVASLTAQGAQVALASGDRIEAVAPAAARLGITEVHAGMAPEAKHAYVAGLQAAGATVAMVGDGLNDAPVLALAHVSVAMGGGAPLAQTSADMVLMSGRPEDLGRAVDIAKKTVRIVRQNIGWAALYNLIAIPLAATGVLTPWMAGLGMSMSSLVVVLNSLRLAGRAPTVRNDVAAVPAAAPQGA